MLTSLYIYEIFEKEKQAYINGMQGIYIDYL